MQSKIDFINSIQLELASGKFTADLYLKYSIPLISRNINSVFEGICKSNAGAKAATAIIYEFELQGDDTAGYYIQLSPRPILETGGIEYVKDGDTNISVRNKMMQNSLVQLRGGVEAGTAWMKTPSQLWFPVKPKNTIIVVALVPNVYEMQDTDMICANGQEAFLKTSVLQLMRAMDTKPQEVHNDNKVDAG